MAVVCGVLYALAWFTHIGWFYAANALAVAIFLLNIPLPWLILRGLSAERSMIARAGGRSEDVFEEDTISLAVELRNRTRFPTFLFKIQEECPLIAPDEEQPGFFVGMVAPQGSITAKYDVRCYRRGVYSLGPILVETAAPFGLFRAQRMLDATLEVTVYPQVLAMETNVNRGSLEGRTPDASPPVHSGEFRASREYQHGDYVQNIHWRNSARRGQLMVKEFDRIPQGEVRLALNQDIDVGEGRTSTLEYAIKIAASVAQRCFLEGRPFQMWPRAQERPLSAWHLVLEHLARLPSRTPASIAEFLDYGTAPGISVLIVSAADRESLAKLMERRSPSPNLTVVLLRDFGPGEDPNAAEKLFKMGFSVLPCGRSDLRATLDSLSRLMSMSEPPARTARAGVRQAASV